MTYTRDGQMVPGFADAVVLTLEENIVAEQIASKLQTNGSYIGAVADEGMEHDANGSLELQARTENGELYGAPAGDPKSPQHDNQLHRDKPAVIDASDQEQAAAEARAQLRRNLTGKSSRKTWTLPTPTPKVDPHGFEDPISDTFWKKVWVACAVHNVSVCILIARSST
jgi:phospholipase D1/2